jgi:hypothetical protein
VNGDSWLEAGRWHVAFVRHGDRFGHEISWRCADGVLHVLGTSLEGAGDEDWPASPPLQELHFERRSADLSVALLVGMAGSSHWSLVVEAHAARECLVFEAACRVHGTPGLLGSRYRLGAGQVTGVPECESALRVVDQGEAWRVSSETLGEAERSPLAFDEATRCLQLAPAPATVNRALTFRWRYCWAREA